MNLKTFKFPSVNQQTMGFSGFKTIPELLTEARVRDFYDGDTPYNRLFSDLFYCGGKVVFKKDLDEDFKAKAWPYLKAFMGSFASKHEEKEAICAMLMSELLEPKLA